MSSLPPPRGRDESLNSTNGGVPADLQAQYPSYPSSPQPHSPGGLTPVSPSSVDQWQAADQWQSAAHWQSHSQEGAYQQGTYQQAAYQQPSYAQPPFTTPGSQPVYVQPPKSRLAAALLAFFFGSFGVHNFYLGYTGVAIAQLLLTLSGVVLSIVTAGFMMFLYAPVWSCVGIWVLVEFILILVSGPDSRYGHSADLQPLR